MCGLLRRILHLSPWSPHGIKYVYAVAWPGCVSLASPAYHFHSTFGLPWLIMIEPSCSHSFRCFWGKGSHSSFACDFCANNVGGAKMRKIRVFRTSYGSKVQETLDVSKRAATKITPDMMLGNREANVAMTVCMGRKSRMLRWKDMLEYEYILNQLSSRHTVWSCRGSIHLALFAFLLKGPRPVRLSSRICYNEGLKNGQTAILARVDAAVVFL